MTDTYWVTTNAGRDKALHSNPQCKYLDRVKNAREAADAEVERYEECRRCAGDLVRGQGDYSHFQAALEAE